MATPQALAIALGLALVVWAGATVVHAARQAGRQMNCIVRTGHKCPKPVVPPGLAESNRRS